MKTKTLLIAIFCMHPLIAEFLGDWVYADQIFVQGYERRGGEFVQGYIRQAPTPQYQWNNQPVHQQLDYNYSPTQPHSNSWGTDFQSER